MALQRQPAGGQQPGLAIDTRLLPGHPAQVLVESSADAAMLVVGSWGAGTLSARFLGSVSQDVATRARCPVVVVREQALPVRREIVVGIGDLGQADRALTAASARADLVVLGRWPTQRPSSGVRSVTHTVLHHAHAPVAVTRTRSGSRMSSALTRDEPARHRRDVRKSRAGGRFGPTPWAARVPCWDQEGGPR